MTLREAYQEAYREATDAGRVRLCEALIAYQAGKLTAGDLAAAIQFTPRRRTSRDCFRRADKWAAVSRARLARCQWYEAERAERRRLEWIQAAFVAAGYGCRQGVKKILRRLPSVSESMQKMTTKNN